MCDTSTFIFSNTNLTLCGSFSDNCLCSNFSFSHLAFDSASRFRFSSDFLFSSSFSLSLNTYCYTMHQASSSLQNRQIFQLSRSFLINPTIVPFDIKCINSNKPLAQPQLLAFFANAVYAISQYRVLHLHYAKFNDIYM